MLRFLKAASEKYPQSVWFLMHPVFMYAKGLFMHLSYIFAVTDC